MIAISDESRHKVLRWLERCKLQLVAYIPDEDKAELAALIAELENAGKVLAITINEARLIEDELIDSAVNDEFTHGGTRDSDVLAAKCAPLREKLLALLRSEVPEPGTGCIPIYPCPECGKPHAIALHIPFVWGCACGHHFGVDYGTSKTGKRCWVYTGVLDLRTEATT